MARESTITFEQVAAAADSIKAQGGKPTSRAVREVLGSGSMATVCKFMQQWQGGQVRQNQVVDDTLDMAIVRAISNQIATKVQEATLIASTQLADLQAEASAIIAENERQAAEIEMQAYDLSSFQDQCSAYAGRVQQLESEVARLIADLATERQAVEFARIALAKAELRLEAVPRIEAEISAVRVELLLSQKQAAEQHEAAAVATARLEAEVAQRKATEGRLVEIRAEAKKFSEEAVALRGQMNANQHVR